MKPPQPCCQFRSQYGRVVASHLGSIFSRNAGSCCGLENMYARCGRPTYQFPFHEVIGETDSLKKKTVFTRSCLHHVGNGWLMVGGLFLPSTSNSCPRLPDDIVARQRTSVSMVHMEIFSRWADMPVTMETDQASLTFQTSRWSFRLGSTFKTHSHVASSLRFRVF